MYTFNLGQKIRLSASFVDDAGDPGDPTGVFLVYRDPVNDPETLEYGVDPELERDSEGAYHADLSLGLSGLWIARWYSTGSIETGSADILIRVRETRTDG